MPTLPEEFDLPLEQGALGWLTDELWSRLEPYVNGPEPDGKERHRWQQTREALDRVLDGKPHLDGNRSDLKLTVVMQKGRVRWGLPEPTEPKELQDERRSALMLLWAPEARRRLFRCERCSRYFMRKRKHRRDRAFCSDECRTEAWRERTGSDALAAYMRRYRNSRKK